jgi:hypothetical protein
MHLLVLSALSLVLFQGQISTARSPEDTLGKAFELFHSEKTPSKVFVALFTESRFATRFRDELLRAERELGKLKIASLLYEDAHMGTRHRLVITYQSAKLPERPYRQIVYVECPNERYVWQLADSGTVHYRSRQEALANRQGNILPKSRMVLKICPVRADLNIHNHGYL